MTFLITKAALAVLKGIAFFFADTSGLTLNQYAVFLSVKLRPDLQNIPDLICTKTIQ